MKDKKEKIILNCCLDCGKKHGTKKNKICFGIWKGNCDMCGKKDVYCASAPHDFGIYSSDEIKNDDKLQDLI